MPPGVAGCSQASLRLPGRWGLGVTGSREGEASLGQPRPHVPSEHPLFAQLCWGAVGSREERLLTSRRVRGHRWGQRAQSDSGGHRGSARWLL